MTYVGLETGCGWTAPSSSLTAALRGCHLGLGGRQAGEGLVGSDVRIDDLLVGRPGLGDAA